MRPLLWKRSRETDLSIDFASGDTVRDPPKGHSTERTGSAMIREKSCGALVLRNHKSADGEKQTYILMIRHTNGGHRSFPKGHVEKGETERMTAEREVREETSVRIHISEKFREAVYYKPRPNSNKEVIYFLAFTKQADVSAREGEIAEVEWVPLSEARDALTHDNDKRVLDAAIEYLKERKLGGF